VPGTSARGPSTLGPKPSGWTRPDGGAGPGIAQVPKRPHKSVFRAGEPLDPPAFSPAVRSGLIDLLTWRRDVRAFRRDALPAATVERLIDVSCLAPSVGLSEPWRFVLVEDVARRRAIRANFESANAAALAAQDGSRHHLYAKLKLAGLDDAPVQIATFADRETYQGHGLGRRTMPDAIEHSVAIAIHTLWLAARVEGIGLGWVSILDPASVNAALDVPDCWTLVGYLCLGYPQDTDDQPSLQRQGWESRRGAACRLIRR
jgi:5,6-dimethylbenzimidazole synthase